MTRRSRESDDGQTVVEFALLLSALLLLTGGLVDVGRAFYDYNAVSAAARYGARWGGVEGGTCSSPTSTSTSDYCNRESLSGSTAFWSIHGNYPLQGYNSFCQPYTTSTASTFYQAMYTGSSPNPATTNFSSVGGAETTLVGAVVSRIDSTGSSSDTLVSAATPGLDLTHLFVCVDGTSASTSGPPAHGDLIGVTVNYVFQPAGPLFGGFTFNLSATSQFVVE